MLFNFVAINVFLESAVKVLPFSIFSLILWCLPGDVAIALKHFFLFAVVVYIFFLCGNL